jgi:uncharacterized protein with PIN domain
MPETSESGQRILRCDFCGEVVAAVRRVAIDSDYERLQTPHKELYACERCSAKKERTRLGRDPG